MPAEPGIKGKTVEFAVGFDATAVPLPLLVELLGPITAVDKGDTTTAVTGLVSPTLVAPVVAAGQVITVTVDFAPPEPGASATAYR